MYDVRDLSNEEIGSVHGGALWLLVIPAIYAAMEIGRGVHGATCPDHKDRND